MSSTDSQAWLNRVASAQRQACSAEDLRRIRDRAARIKRNGMQAKKAGRLSKTMQVCDAAWRSGMRSLGASEAVEDTEVRYRSLASAASLTMDSMQVVSGAFRCADGAEEDEEQLEQQLQMQEQTMVANGTLDSIEAATLSSANGATAAAAEEQSLAEVLRSLEDEPADSEACAAKFQLYENYSSVVTDARRATMSLWEEVAGEFDAAPATKQHCERTIQAIDKHANLGIADDPRRWYVHGMVKQSARNARTIDGVLGEMRTKLELLTSQTECPVCLEPFGTERPASALSCAHKVCAECWGHWSAMSPGSTTFCPLCRHEEFLERILSAA